jgi:hypothetical protein
LDRNPANRIGAKGDVNEIINHPFFKDVDFDKLQKKLIEAPYKPSVEQMTLKDSEIM